ncbi:glycosyltransferase family 2 protein [Streptococcus suis]|nr:glycosyltransferase family 2 protein [Streptococcus sp. 29896]MBL6537184.1 glycosyltransferase family 2 protein [Streptococcus suis]MBM7268951.1 glycosyltransferase family 2 protein [Streptococcus suis]MBM7269335.1 glycosyltransferase family 2 protein [Streptococcus suis]MCK4027513.1 glycosyltransferase family 2 protein [Streptococcus suis]WNY47897.1 glycosyltransferase family 2 protein [Streptococcus sp. 29896]
MSKVSIIVPVYNTEPYLEECILSLRNQTLQDIQIILVDDASRDQSLTIMNQQAAIDDRIQVIALEENSGVGLARNLGIQQAQGDFLAFVDSDDYVKPEMFEKLYQKAIEESADIVLCDTDTFSSNGQKKSVWYKPINGKPQLKDIYHNTQPTSRIVSKALIDQIQFSFLPGMGEGIFFELMIQAKKIVTVPEKLYVYRSRDGSLSTTPNPRINIESKENNRIMGERNPAYKDYFTFKVIEDLLQLVATAVKINDHQTYKNAVQELNDLNYRKNPYLSTFYKDEYPWHRYYIKAYLLPANFSLARLIHRLTQK